MLTFTPDNTVAFDCPSLHVPASYRRVPFNMHCAARQCYLLIAADDGSDKTLNRMEHIEGDRWGLALRLKPGIYRYRYYAEYPATTTYLRPDEVDDDPIRMDGFDSILTVPESYHHGVITSNTLAGGCIREIETMYSDDVWITSTRSQA